MEQWEYKRNQEVSKLQKNSNLGCLITLYLILVAIFGGMAYLALTYECFFGFISTFVHILGYICLLSIISFTLKTFGEYYTYKERINYLKSLKSQQQYEQYCYNRKVQMVKKGAIKALVHFLKGIVAP